MTKFTKDSQGMRTDFFTVPARRVIPVSAIQNIPLTLITPNPFNVLNSSFQPQSPSPSVPNSVPGSMPSTSSPPRNVPLKRNIETPTKPKANKPFQTAVEISPAKTFIPVLDEIRVESDSPSKASKPTVCILFFL